MNTFISRHRGKWRETGCGFIPSLKTYVVQRCREGRMRKRTSDAQRSEQETETKHEREGQGRPAVHMKHITLMEISILLGQIRSARRCRSEGQLAGYQRGHRLNHLAWQLNNNNSKIKVINRVQMVFL